jgi:predicted DNA-binding transcriptional regulator AlpA
MSTFKAQIDRLLTDREAASILSMSRPTFRRRVAAGEIPQPIKLGFLSRWAESEIIAHIEAAKARRATRA